MSTRTLLTLMVALAVASCATDTDTGLQRGTAAACSACTSDLDCAAGLLCDQDGARVDGEGFGDGNADGAVAERGGGHDEAPCGHGVVRGMAQRWAA